MSNTDPAAIDSLTELLAAYQAADSNVYASVAALVEQEETRAMAREAELQLDIDAEEAARMAADAAEAAAREAADMAEAAAREAADMAEASARAAADAAEEAARMAADAAEAAARAEEDLTFLKLDGSRPMSGTLLSHAADMDGVGISGLTVESNFDGSSVTNISESDSSKTEVWSTGVYSTRTDASGSTSSALDSGLFLDKTLANGASSHISTEWINEQLPNLSILATGPDTQNQLKRLQLGINYKLVDGVKVSSATILGNNLKLKSLGAGETAVFLDNQTLSNVADPQSSQDAATKKYVDSFKPVAPVKFVLTSTDISNQYVELNVASIVEYSVIANVDRLYLLPEELTESVVSGKVRLSFAGSIASGGEQALEAGDVLTVRYWVR